MVDLGDVPVNAVLDFKWNTQGANGASITRATDGTLKLYKGNSTTERSSLAGVTQTEDFDSATGVHHVRIDLSDNTDSGFYASGSEYQVVMTGMTIDGQTVNAVIAHFSIERANGILALLKSGTFGLSALKTLIDTLDDFVDTEVAAIKAKTDNLPSDPADQSLIIAATDAVMARLGTPVGASIAADIATRATPAQVNTEVVDALSVDTYAEPGQAAPAATTTLTVKLSYLYKAWRNKVTQTATEYKLFADDASTVDQKATLSDDATTLTKGEIATGP